MTIGIAAMFILFSLGAGAEKAFESALSSMGKNLLAVGSVRRETDALRLLRAVVPASIELLVYTPSAR